MSYTTFGVNDANAVKIWSKYLARAERDSLDIARLMGESEDSIIQIRRETERGPGDLVKFNIRFRPTGRGFTEGQTAEGNGEELSIYQDSVVINELGHVVSSASKNTIDQQRVPWDLRRQCKDALAEWWRDRRSVSFFNQVCGFTPQTDTAYTGLNAVAAPSAGRKIVAGSGANDENITSNDTFTVGLIDQAVEMATVGNSKIRATMIDGQPRYVMYLHPYQVTSLRSAFGAGGWADIQKAAMAGMEASRNPIFTGALGMYNRVILRESQDVTQGVNSSTGAAIPTVRRAVLLGAQAAVVAFGNNGYGPNQFRWHERLFDHDRLLEVSAWQIWGCKKVQFNSTDHGAIVVSTYAAASA
ncbi:MAG TPA: N4-gp56 family major capsid protein [Hyphomicrobiaceae bacterium]|nr:N4-gp56 family major capsid protein [Hyphomicrobiaceae bacterium]